jgi:hypothetical protein
LSLDIRHSSFGSCIISSHALGIDPMKAKLNCCLALVLLLISAIQIRSIAESLPPPKPTPEQLAWQKMEFIAFAHFGMNTFTGREWGEGKEDPKLLSSYYLLIRQLRPKALIAICGPDIRWVGNENGLARENETSVQPAGTWYPAECDVSIRPGWFYHAEEDSKVKTLDQLMNIYYQSVGRNSVLLLNQVKLSQPQRVDHVVLMKDTA